MILSAQTFRGIGLDSSAVFPKPIPLKVLLPNATIDKMYAIVSNLCIFMLKTIVFVSVFDDYAYQIELFA